MLFMLIVKASTASEQGLLPNEELRAQMSEFNQSLLEAGVRVMAKGLHPTTNALRIKYLNESDPPVVEEGPFGPPSDLLAGFIIIDVESKEEAVKWAMKMPDPQGLGEGQIELRQIFE